MCHLEWKQEHIQEGLGSKDGRPAPMFPVTSWWHERARLSYTSESIMEVAGHRLEELNGP